MSIDREELVNLDATIAAFIIPRLIAFRDTTDSYPADLDDMGEWHDELDSMIAAFQLVANLTDPNTITASLETQDSRPGLRLFAERLGHLWL